MADIFVYGSAGTPTFKIAPGAGLSTIEAPAGTFTNSTSIVTPKGATFVDGFTEEAFAIPLATFQVDSVGDMIPAHALVMMVTLRVIATFTTSINRISVWNFGITNRYARVDSTVLNSENSGNSVFGNGTGVFSDVLAAPAKISLFVENAGATSAGGKVTVTTFWRQFSAATT